MGRQQAQSNLRSHHSNAPNRNSCPRLEAVTKEFYPGIAKKYDTAASRVERGIRHAIELAWERGQKDTLKQIFGYSMNVDH